MPQVGIVGYYICAVYELTETVYQIAKETGRGIVHVNISETKSMWFGKPSLEVNERIWRSKLEWLDEEGARRLAASYGFSGGEIDNVVRKVIKSGCPEFPDNQRDPFVIPVIG